ncbi:YqaA family protein [Microvirga aerophila]|uniref:YqaA family protein n=1 Tax=Microvirga aerophila TaxID=670291 RepID=UPI00403A59C1
MEHFSEYFGLAGAAFLSATVFPFQSEVILFGMLMAEHYHVWLLVLVASLGNILGSCVNWFLGRFIAYFEDRPWFRSPRTTSPRRRAGTTAMGAGPCCCHGHRSSAIRSPLSQCPARALSGVPRPDSGGEDGALPDGRGSYARLDVDMNFPMSSKTTGFSSRPRS